VWYKHDLNFKKPKSNLFFDIVTPVTYQNPRSCVSAKLFSRLLADSLNEFAYDADLCGLFYTLSATIEGLQLVVRGYNCKQIVLLQKVIERLANFRVDKERFELIKETVTREYKNFQMEQPFTRALYNINLCIENLRWSNEEYIEAIEEITAEQLQEFIPRLLEGLFIESLMHGNISHEDVITMMHMIETILKPRPLINTFQEQRAAKLCKENIYLYRMKGLDPENINSAIENYYQIGSTSIQITSILDTFCQITQSPVFSQLRTNEQLGYLVFSGSRSDCGIEGYRIIVQSSVKDPAYLDERIETFLKEFREVIIKMPEDEWLRNLSSVITKKLEKDKSLKQESYRYWKEIVNPHTYIFDRAQREVELIEKIQKQDIIGFYDKYISPDSKHRRKFTSQVWGKGFEMGPVEDLKKKHPNLVVIEDKRVFKRSLPLFPLVYNGHDRRSKL